MQQKVLKSDDVQFHITEKRKYRNNDRRNTHATVKYIFDWTSSACTTHISYSKEKSEGFSRLYLTTNFIYNSAMIKNF